MTRLFHVALIGTLLAAAGAAAADEPPGYVLQAKPVRRIEGVDTFEVAWPNFKAKEWVVGQTALPELPSQKKVSTKLSLDGTAGTELSPLKRPIILAKVTVKDKKEQTRLHYTATYQATLLERKLVPLAKGKQPPKVDPLTDAERKWYLAPTTTFYDYETKAFRDWLDKHELHIKPRETEVDFARRSFLVIYDSFGYEIHTDIRSASAVCKAGKSQCGGLSTLFVAIMRANGVPARSLVGLWAEPPKGAQPKGNTADPHHTRAEFFAAGIGWVPVDPSVAIYWHKGKRETALSQDFGYDAGNFLVTQIEYDLQFDIEGVGKQTLPWTWCTTWPRGEGELTNPVLKDEWKVRPLPLP